MEALGLIETRGLLAAVEAADTMVKSAEVSIVEKTYVGGGLVTIVVTGDVGAVKAAIESGEAAVKKLDQKHLVSVHIIPRPHEELQSIIGYNTQLEVLEVPSSDKDVKVKDGENVENIEHVEDIEGTKDQDKEIKNILETDLDKLHKVSLQNLHKGDVDDLVSKNGIEKTILILSKLKVVKLRNLAREYEDFVITGRMISKADKNLLVTKFKSYYYKN